MTRLKTEDIDEICDTMEDFDRELLATTGHSLKQIAAHSVRIPPDSTKLEKSTVGVVPLTCGLGVIGKFAQSVAAIVSYLGPETTVTTATDAAGIAEAVEAGVDVLMLADDLRFVALNLHNRRLADNGECTGKGFAAALDLMVKGVAGRPVLVLGAGPVGTSAAIALTEYGAQVNVLDINLEAARCLSRTVADRTGKQVKLETDLEAALSGYSLIFDATPAGDFILPRHLNTGHAKSETRNQQVDDTYMAIPGIPPGPTRECMELLAGKVIFNPLQLGVATMLFEVLGG